MTVAALTPSIDYLENGVTLGFAAPFRFLPGSIAVSRVLSDGTVILLIAGVDYSTSGGTTDAGGTVTLVSSVAGAKLRIRRTTARTQSMDYTPGDRFPAESHEAAIDRAMLIDQEQDAAIADTASRALRVADGETINAFPSRVGQGGQVLGLDGGSPPQPVWITPGGADSALRSDMANPLLGAGLSAFSHGTGYSAGTIGRKLRQFIDPRDPPFNAVGDGVTDDTLALQAALNTGAKVWLQPGVTYAFGARLSPVSGGGFVGGGKLLMLTGAGKFDAAAYGGGYATNKTGILIDGQTRTCVQAVIEMQTNAGIRTCHAIQVMNSTDIALDVECFGFKEAEYAVVSWDSNVRGFVKANVHDCGFNSTSLGSVQLTGFCIDANRTVNGNSRGCLLDVQIVNIRLGAAAFALYGEQTDGVNFQAVGYGGHNGRIYAENVGEAFDCFTSGCTIHVTAKSILYSAVKLVHGAQYNNIVAAINLTGWHAVVFSGSAVGQPSTQYNQVRAVCTQVGELASGLANAAAVAFDGQSAAVQPNNNEVWVLGIGNGVGMKHVVYIEAGAGNVVNANGGGFATQFGFIDSGAGLNNLIRRSQPTHIRANLNGSTITRDSLIAFDNGLSDVTGEYNVGTYTATLRCAGRYRVRAQLRITGVPTLVNIGFEIQRNGVAIARSTPINMAASSQELWPATETIVDCQAGDTINVICRGSTGTNYTVTGNAAFSFLEIDQI